MAYTEVHKIIERTSCLTGARFHCHYHTLVFSIKAHQTQKTEPALCFTAVKADIRIPYISSEVDTILINFFWS